jgi:hypothetical protein
MRPIFASAVLALALLAAPAAAHAAAFLPPPGQNYAGVTMGDPGVFAQQAGAHPAVYQSFANWNGTFKWVFDRATAARARVMMHLSTFNGPGTAEVITPAQIARGDGDAYLVALGDEMARHGRPVYLRLMAEMNGHWNPYSAYTKSGPKPGSAHSTASFRQAWRRTVTVLRGGPVAAIDARLRALGLPLVRTDRADLAVPQVAFLWVPQVAGAPDVPGNSPRAYWPGGEYVDWVGTDFYSKFPNWRGLERFHDAFAGKPFVLGEWAVWGADDPRFVHSLFAWTRSHPRVRMLMYNQGSKPRGPFSMATHPRSAAAMRAELARPAWAPYTPDWTPQPPG